VGELVVSSSRRAAIVAVLCLALGAGSASAVATPTAPPTPSPTPSAAPVRPSATPSPSRPALAPAPKPRVSSKSLIEAPKKAKAAVAATDAPAVGGPGEYQYDAAGRLVGVVQNGGQAAKYSYDAAGNVTGVTRYSATTLAMVSVVPASARPGASVTLYGTGFPTTGAVVKFNGTSATVTNATATALTVTVPAGVTTGAVTVTSGTTTATGPIFTLAPAGSAVTAVSPATGPPGTAVTLTGSGFSTERANSVVTFNGLRAEVTSASATSLVVNVPVGATSGSLDVATPNGTAHWTNDFVIPPSGVDPATIESSRRIAVGSAPVPVPVATGGKVALALVDTPASRRLNVGFSASTFGGYIDVSLLDARGRQVDTASGSGVLELDASNLPAGTNQIVIDPSSTLTGQVQVTVSTPLTSVLSTTASGAALTFSRVGQSYAGTLAVTAGQRVSLGVSGNALTGYSEISVIDPDGATVVDQKYVGSASTATARFVGSATGTYTVVLDPSPGATGALTLTAAVAVAAGTLTATGPALPANLARPGQAGVWTFAGAAGQSTNLGLAPNTLTTYSYLTVLTPDGSKLGSPEYVSSASSGFVPLDSLPTTGTYTVLVEPEGGTGSVTLTYSNQVDAGTLSTTGAASTAVTIARAGQGARASFTGTAGQPMTLAVSANTLTSSSYVDIYAADGTKLVNSDYVSSASDNVTFFSPTANGTYTIRFRPSNGATGSFALTLSSRLNAGSLSTSGAGLAATAARPGQEIAYTFTGAAGQNLSLGLSANTFAKSFDVRLIDPAGTLLTSWSDYVSAGEKAAVRLPTITTAGTYTILLRSDYAQTGSVTSVLSTELAATSAVGGTGTAVSVARAGQSIRLSVTGVPATGEVTVAFTGVSYPTFANIDLTTPGGTTTTSKYYLSSSDTKKALFLPSPISAGTYTLLIRPDVAATGSFTVTSSAAVTVAAQIGAAPVTVTTTKPGQQARVQFTGTAGSNVSVGVTANSVAAYQNVYLVLPDGTRQSSTWYISSSSTGDLDFTALPATGTYTLVFQPGDTVSGSFTATTSAELASGTITVGGAAKAVSIARAGQNARMSFTGTSGQTLTVGYSGSTLGSNGQLSVYAPSGAAIVSDRFFSGASGSFALPALTATGTYQLVLDPYAAGTGAVNLTLTAGAPVAPAAAPKAAVQPTAPRSAGSSSSPGTESRTDRTSTSAWHPDRGNLKGIDWSTRRVGADVPSDLRAAPGETAVAGHVLTLDGKALRQVTVSAGPVTTRTDAHGRFLLRGVAPNTKTIIVDGASASRKGTRYGLFRIQVNARAARTVSLPATVWMPRLDTEHQMRISAPTTRETVLTTPEIPGLQIRIPKGSVVKDVRGRVVTELGITPIPIDRPPYPLPPNGIVPVFFTVQPGGAAVFPDGAQVVYPNYTKLPAGHKVDFYNYDPAGKGWYVYGHGQVSADAQHVVPDAKTRIWTFDGAMFNVADLPPWLTSWFKDTYDWLSGDPVELSTGKMVDHRTDLALDDVMPIELSRTLWQGDTNSREFGVGQIADYGMFLHSENQYQETDLYVPGGAKIHYVRTSAGTGYTDAEFVASGTSSEFRNSTIKWYSPITGWELRLSDGTRWRFPMYSRATQILDRDGNQITLTRSSAQNGDLTQITSPSGRWIKLTYDTSRRVIGASDNTGRTVGYTYYPDGRLNTVTDVAGKVLTYTYVNGQVDTIKDARQIVYLDNDYDANGRIFKQTLPGGLIYQFNYTLDANGKVAETRVTQPNGSVRRVVFNAAGVPTSDTAAYGTSFARTTTFTRGTDQRVDVVTDPYNRKTNFGYDSAGRINSVTVLAGTADQRTTSSLTFGAFDLPKTMTDADNKTTNYDYYANGDLKSVTDPENRISKFTWTADGQIETATDPNNKTTSFTYRSGDLISVTDPTGRVSKQFVDGAGRVLTSTDPAGATSAVVYDKQNQPMTVTDALGQVTKLEYDENGNLKKLTDARLKPLSWTYDDGDRMKTATDQLGKITNYDYDAAGRPKAVTTRAGRKTTMDYDPLDRPTVVKYGVNAAGTAQESSATFGYDALDRPKTVTDTQGGTATTDYDAYDQVKSQTQTRGSVSYTYDNVGRPWTVTVGGQTPATYRYDTSGLLKSITQGSASVGVTYTPAGRADTLSLPGAWTQKYGYDDAGRVTGVTYANSGTTKGGLTYGYDPSGRVRTVSGSLAGVQLPAARSGLVYNDANRLTTAGSATLTYDDDGNLTNDGTAAYTWNARGDLTGVSKTGLTASFAYDALGGRAARTVNGTKTGFLNDGANTVAELDASNNVSASLLSGGVDQWLSRTKAGATDAVLTDPQGSPVALGAADGTLAARYAYDPFGTPTTSGTTRGADLSYTGRQDDGTGLMYYRARYYSPSLQRFISEDPAGVAGGANLYAYGANSPTNTTDPSGNNPLLIGCAIGGSSGALGDWAIQRLSGRKVSWGEVGASAVGGCLMGGGEFWWIARSGRLINAARAARDIRAAEVGRRKATVTGAYDIIRGRVVSGCSSNPVGCAEDDVVRQLNVSRWRVRFTEAIRPRTGEEIPICKVCQSSYRPWQFPRLVKWLRGGPWER
jgi:RHS repeat-associated protein